MSPIAFSPLANTSTELGFHEAAAIFDLLEGAAFDELVADIKTHGQRMPIMLFEGKILDGRNRYNACKAAGVPPTFRQWDGTGSPSELVWSLNHVRRHLHGNARALAAGRYAVTLQAESKKRQLANLKRGDKLPRSAIADVGGKERSHEIAAKEADLPAASVERAAKVVKKGSPELQKAAAEDRISISAAAAVADEDAETQRAIVESPDVKKAVKALQDAKALKAEADATPPSKPLSAEEHANVAKAVGSKEQRDQLRAVLDSVAAIAALPEPSAMVGQVPAALAHSIDIIAILRASNWLEDFARAWERNPSQ